MERTAGSTLTREEDVGLRVSAHSEPPELAPPDARPVVPDNGHIRGRRLIREGRIVFLLALGVYLVAAVLLDFKYRTFALDSFSRMANGFYIIYSRDPHLSAVGFVWDPLTSVADMVVLLGNHLWPALSHNNMAGSLVSAVAMAGAVYQLCAALREWGVSRIPRLVLTAFFALNPMIVFYGGNGMSEGLFLFTLMAGTRYLLRWMHGGDLRSLAYGAVALGFCYLTRNEAALAALLGGVAVGVVSYWRTDGRLPSRIRTAMSDLAIFGAPALTAAVGWAVVSYVITGQYFAQIQSIYGSAAQEKLLSHKTLHGRILYEVHAIAAFAPLLPILLIAAVVVAYRRRDPRMLAPLTVLGGALGFDMVSYLGNGIQDYLRYWIVALPLGILLLGCLVSAVQNPRRAPGEETLGPRPSHSRVRLLGVLTAVCLVLVVMIPTTVFTGSSMFDAQIGGEETSQLAYIFKSHPTAGDLAYPDAYPQSLALARWFDDRHLPNGDVVVDNSVGCMPIVIVTSSQPKLFVIPNDRDYQRILADPITFHTHYILEADPASFPNTPMNFQYPGLWRSGAGFTRMVHQFPAARCVPRVPPLQGPPPLQPGRIVGGSPAHERGSRASDSSPIRVMSPDRRSQAPPSRRMPGPAKVDLLKPVVDELRRHRTRKDR